MDMEQQGIGKIGFLGAGKMAEALIAALLRRQEPAGPRSLLACDLLEQRRRHLGEKYGIRVYDQPRPVVEQADTLVLAVKPQDLAALLRDIAPLLERRHLLVSIAAGKPLSFIQSLVGPGTGVARVMPNLPVQVGFGMSVYCLAPGTAGRQQVEQLLGCAGRTLELPESMFDQVTALSGSGPAFLAWFLRQMMATSVKAGLPPEAAGTLARQTFLGTAHLLAGGGWQPDELIRAVSSKGGTTAAGIEVLEQSAAAGIIEQTLRAAADRSRELTLGQEERKPYPEKED